MRSVIVGEECPSRLDITVIGTFWRITKEAWECLNAWIFIGFIPAFLQYAFRRLDWVGTDRTAKGYSGHSIKLSK
jgi:hypothetical protein